MDSKVTLRKWR